MTHHYSEPFDLIDNLVFARNLIWGAICVTIAVCIPIWAVIGTIYAVRRIFGIE